MTNAPPGKPMFSPPMWGLLLAAVAAAAVYPAMMIAANEYDSCTFQWIGRRMWAGDVPYRDLWDNKFPLLYWLNATAAATGHPAWAIYVMQSLAVAAGGWMIYGIGRRLGGSLGEWPGRIAGLAYVTFAGTQATLMTGNLTENWAAPLAILCTYAMVRYVDDEPCQASWPFLSGLGMGAAACLRQPAVLVGAALLVLLPATWRRKRVTALAVMAWLIGLLLLPLLMLAWARRGGVMAEMLDQCVRFNLAYGTSGTRPNWATWPNVASRFSELALSTWPWHAAALAGLAVLLFYRAAPRSARQRTLFQEHVAQPPPAVNVAQPPPAVILPAGGGRTAEIGPRGQPGRSTPGGNCAASNARPPVLPVRSLIVVWLAAALASSLPSLRFYVHHYYLALAPLSLLIGGLWRPMFGDRGEASRLRMRLGWAVAAVAAAAVLLHFNKVFSDCQDKVRWSRPVRQAGDFLELHSTPDQTLFVFAWGQESDLLARLGRPSPTRHVMVLFYPELHTGAKMLAQWEREMIARPPDWLLCRAGLDLVTDHHLKAPVNGELEEVRWQASPKTIDWNQPSVRRFADAVHDAYRDRYTPVASFDPAGSPKGQPNPDRLIVYRRIQEMDNPWQGPVPSYRGRGRAAGSRPGGEAPPAGGPFTQPSGGGPETK